MMSEGSTIVNLTQREGGDDSELVDLSGTVHQLPCAIKYNGPCSVSNFFKPRSTGKTRPQTLPPFLSVGILFFFFFFCAVLGVLGNTGIEVEGLKVEEAYFRGRKLQGTTIPLSTGYCGMQFFFSLYSFLLIRFHDCLAFFFPSLSWCISCIPNGYFDYAISFFST